VFAKSSIPKKKAPQDVGENFMRVIFHVIPALVMSALAIMAPLAPALAGSVGLPFKDAFSCGIFGCSQNIAVLNNGMLVNVGYDGTSAPNTVQFQFYSAAGVQVGPRVTSAPQPGYPNTVVASYAQVTALAGGGFVVTAYTTGGNPEVRTYTSAGVPTSGWVLVTSDDNGATLTTTVALPGGGFYVSWSDNHLSGNIINLGGLFGKVFEGQDVFAKRYSATAEEIDVKYHLIGQPLEGFANQQTAGYPGVLTNGTVAVPVFNWSLYCSLNCSEGGGAYEIYVSLTTRSGPATPSSILVAPGFTGSFGFSTLLVDNVDPNFNPVAVGLAGGGFAVIFERKHFGPAPDHVFLDDTIDAAFFDAAGTKLFRTTLATVAGFPREGMGQYGVGAVPLANGGFAMAYSYWTSVTTETGFFGTAVLEVSATGAVTDNVVVNPPALTGGQDDYIVGLTVGQDGKLYITLSNFPGTSGGDQTLHIRLE
jgi:hypothetical protein